MTVRRVGRPVAVRGQQLHAHQPVGPVEDAGGHEVGHLARRRPRPPDFDRYLLSPGADRVEAPGGPGGRQGHLGPAGRRQPHLGVHGNVGPVADLGEDVVAAGQGQPPAFDVDVDGSGQRQHGHLLVTGGDVEVDAGGQADDAQPGVRPPRHLRGQVHQPVGAGQ